LAVFEAFLCLLEAIARDRTLVLLLDDVERADPSTWELLHYFARNAPRSAVLIVLAVRVGQSARETAAPLTPLLKDELATELRLRPLAKAELGTLAAQTLGPDAAQAALAEWLFERTGGNALFAVALLDDLAVDPAARQVPVSVQAHIESMAAGLDADARALLEIAAVLGHSFRLRTIARLMSTDATRRLDELSRRGLLREVDRDGATSYEFAHPLMQEVVYESIGRARRRELHEHVARVLTDEPIAVRAYHAARGALAGDVMALALIRDAAREAERAEAHHEALQFLDAARQLIDPGSDGYRGVLDEIGWQAGEAADHVAGVPALRELLRLETSDRDRAVVHVRLSSLLSASAGDLGSAEREASEAVRLFETAGAHDQLAAATNELAWIRGERGDLAAQIAGSQDALRRAEQTGDERSRLHSLGSLGYALAISGRSVEAVTALGRSLEIAKTLDDRGQVGWHTGALCLALLIAGRVGEAAAIADRFVEGAPTISSVARQHRALLNLLLGRWEPALDDCRAAQAMHPGEMPVHAAWTLAIAGLIEVAQDRGPTARRHLAQSDRMYATKDFYCFAPMHHWLSGYAQALEGDPRGGRERLVGARSRLAEMDAAGIEMLMLPDLVEVLVDAADLTGAASAAERAATLAERMGTGISAANAAYCAAIVRSARSRAEAEKMLRAAVDDAERTGLRFLRARALARLADVVDGAARVQTLTDAARAFAELPARRLEQRVIADLRASGSQGRRSAQAVGDLTAREREVVALVRSGLANREIADRLHLSERTIETHLAHIYGKLGIGGRRELVTEG